MFVATFFATDKSVTTILRRTKAMLNILLDTGGCSGDTKRIRYTRSVLYIYNSNIGEALLKTRRSSLRMLRVYCTHYTNSWAFSAAVIPTPYNHPRSGSTPVFGLSPSNTHITQTHTHTHSRTIYKHVLARASAFTVHVQRVYSVSERTQNVPKKILSWRVSRVSSYT